VLPPQGYDITRENFELVASRPDGFPLPRLRGFDEDGMPDGSEPFYAQGPSGTSTATFMTPAEFHSAAGVDAAGRTGEWGAAGWMLTGGRLCARACCV
jgi:hypothetical protein